MNFSHAYLVTPPRDSSLTTYRSQSHSKQVILSSIAFDPVFDLRFDCITSIPWSINDLRAYEVHVHAWPYSLLQFKCSSRVDFPRRKQWPGSNKEGCDKRLKKILNLNRIGNCKGRSQSAQMDRSVLLMVGPQLLRRLLGTVTRAFLGFLKSFAS